ncbi:DNA-binding domain-containing protein [Amphritea sp. 1_MG-2023]|uniref:HvfC/BufC N-terminal domain-containing protein n=1 Tax=Amphritea sp. 1_MG-2023 TaxID=3062670 RepID=UPI0026E18B86|nr:DNA-binding domain-containing protein [Amphritea sp. 1_MG-2023]MDO6562695.1 DNA-binding domain-containing protein [Amphritea sp. 1_MG-2023]
MKSSLHQRQQQMMQALLHGNDEITQHIVCDTLDAQQRLSIYQTGYRLRLREVIDNDHPILGHYLGDTLFEQLIEGYIDAVPSAFRSLRYYCDPLPDYLSNDPFFSQHPQIAELARFERCLLDSFDAADCDSASTTTLQQIPAADWPTLQLRFHPSLQLFNTPFNVVDIWQALKAEHLPPAPQQQTACWVVWRNQERLTEFRSAEPIEQTLLNCFLQGGDCSLAAEIIAAQTNATSAANELLTLLLRWLALGWIQQLVHGQSPPNVTPVN